VKGVGVEGSGDEVVVRICAHYFSHAAWLEEGALLRDTNRLAGIPGILIHGRLDMGSPLKTTWELARCPARCHRRLGAYRQRDHEERNPRRARPLRPRAEAR
jgi:hypothetical protein